MHTVPELKEELESVDEPGVIEQATEIEKQNAGRKTALEALNKAQEQLTDETEETEYNTDPEPETEPETEPEPEPDGEVEEEEPDGGDGDGDDSSDGGSSAASPMKRL